MEKRVNSKWSMNSVALYDLSGDRSLVRTAQSSQESLRSVKLLSSPAKQSRFEPDFSSHGHQEQVDDSPPFPAVLESCSQFLQRNGLIDSNGQPLVRFCWCSDGPWDIRDFVVKQCFISKVSKAFRSKRL